MNEPPPLPRLILVTGATGYIGGRLVPRLRERGYPVRCLARDPGRLAGRGWGEIEAVAGDVLDPETLPAVMVGVDTAFYLVHSMAGGEHGFAERDRVGAANFARAARAAGVRRVVYLGGLGASDTGLSHHLASRQETGDVLRAEGPPLTEFRAGVIVGAGSLSFEMIRYLTERVPVMICPRWVSTRCQPIAVRDVLAYLIACLEEPRSAGRVLEIGGPEVMTYSDMISTYAKARGLRRLMIPVPVLTPRLSSYWVDLVTPIPAAIARPLIEGLRSEVVVRDPAARDLFPQIVPLDFGEAVRLALDRVKRRDVETVWSMALSSSQPDGPLPLELKSEQGMLMEVHKRVVEAPASRIYHTFLGIGGRRGWFGFDWAWRLRAWMDRLVGGVGFRRGRRDPDVLYPGEAVDWWRAEEVTPDKRLRLRAEMKVPGRAWLQFDVRELEVARSELTVTAFFEPKGLLGLLYWYMLVPIHPSIFRGLTRAIGDRAVAAERAETRAAAGRG